MDNNQANKQQFQKHQSQARSYSISGQDQRYNIHYDAGLSIGESDNRFQNLHLHANTHPNQQHPDHSRMHQLAPPYLQSSPIGRSPSPATSHGFQLLSSSVSHNNHHLTDTVSLHHRDDLILLNNNRQYSRDHHQRQTPRNHMHASLEGLNSLPIYNDYGPRKNYHQAQLIHRHQQQQQQHQQEQHQHLQQYQLFEHQHQSLQLRLQHQPPHLLNHNGQQQLLQQTHQNQALPSGQIQQNQYAASYIHAPKATINSPIQNSDGQDLAAAAMGPDPPRAQHHDNQQQQYQLQQQQRELTINKSTGYYGTPNLFNRNMSQVSQSPMRRFGNLTNSTNSTSTSGTNGTNLLSQISSPIRAGYSSLSLASSSLIIEEKLQNEIKKLQSELKSEKEKNEALNSQLNINSSLMGAFEQSLTTLNTRLRQLTALNDTKDKELEELRKKQCKPCQESSATHETHPTSPVTTSTPTTNPNESKDDLEVIQSNSSMHRMDDFGASHPVSPVAQNHSATNVDDSLEKQALKKQVDELKKQLMEKDRLLTDMRLEALSTAHQMEQLESKMNRDHSLVNQDDEGYGENKTCLSSDHNHSPSDIDHSSNDARSFNKINEQMHMQTNDYKSYISSVSPHSDSISSSTNQVGNQNNNSSFMRFSEARCYDEDRQQLADVRTDLSNNLSNLNLNWSNLTDHSDNSSQQNNLIINNKTFGQTTPSSTMTSPGDNQSSHSLSDNQVVQLLNSHTNNNNGASNNSDADQRSLKSDESSSYDNRSMGGNEGGSASKLTIGETNCTNLDGLHFLNSPLMTK